MRILAATALCLVLTSCSGDGTEEGSEDSTIRVFAASSLTASFEDIAEAFEAENEGVEVELSFGGSSDLVAQIQEGAPADVFASADEANMDKLLAEDLVGQDPQDFASNTLQIVVPAGNPAGVESLADLADDDLFVVVCAPEVPCGAASQRAADAAGVTLAPDSEEQAVTDVLAKVTSGEADAGLVYVTDVLAAGEAVEGITFPEAASAVNVYPITTVATSEESDLAEAFVALVLGATGQEILGEAGFGAP